MCNCYVPDTISRREIGSSEAIVKVGAPNQRLHADAGFAARCAGRSPVPSRGRWRALGLGVDSGRARRR